MVSEFKCVVFDDPESWGFDPFYSLKTLNSSLDIIPTIPTTFEYLQSRNIRDLRDSGGWVRVWLGSSTFQSADTGWMIVWGDGPQLSAHLSTWNGLQGSKNSWENIWWALADRPTPLDTWVIIVSWQVFFGSSPTTKFCQYYCNWAQITVQQLWTWIEIPIRKLTITVCPPLSKSSLSIWRVVKCDRGILELSSYEI